MAHKRSKNTRRSAETFDFANEVASPKQKPKIAYRPSVHHSSPKLTPIEDRRTWHPQGKTRPARSLDKSNHRLVISKPTHSVVRPGQTKRASAKPKMLPYKVQFAAPQKVLVCIRRKTRKEVLHALNRTGKGARAKRHRQSYYSSIRC